MNGGRWVPSAVTIVASLALLAYGPIHQFADYHSFADQRVWLGVPRAGDVLSNVGSVSMWRRRSPS